MSYIHGRDPTTARHGNFWLLSFLPGPFRSSLANLHPLNSFNGSMLMPNLVRTPDQHARSRSRNPRLKSSTLSSLPEAGLQMRATHPAEVLMSDDRLYFLDEARYKKLASDPQQTAFNFRRALNTVVVSPFQLFVLNEHNAPCRCVALFHMIHF